MGDLEQNSEIWTTWDWSDEGEVWSNWWGGSRAMWYGALLPRVHAFLPAATVLEIAPGYGRWTQYLKEYAEQLIVVDLTDRCIDHCRNRFVDSTNIEYHVNDGRSLGMIADRTVDFAFSFDSLVHVEADVIQSYLTELARTLTSEGVAFLHHSNAGRYPRVLKVARHTPERLRRPLVNLGALPDVYAWRAESVTAQLVARTCEQLGLVCVAQESICWEHGWFLTDTLSLVTRRGSVWDRPPRISRNPGFRYEGRRMTRSYSRTGFGATETGGYEVSA